jgi:glucose-6-phosphate isomerase
MQLPDEAITYQYQNALQSAGEEWTPVAELRLKHLLPGARLKTLAQQIVQVRSQVATERELQNPPPEMKPLHAGFIDLPQKQLDLHRRRGEASELGRILKIAGRVKDLVDRVIFLGVGGSYLGAKALCDALVHTYHNELPAKTRMGVPRIYFEGNNFDNDSLQDLLELLENSCVDSDIRDERYGIVVISKGGDTLETAAAFRTLRNEAVKYYGPHSDMWKQVIIPVTGPSGKLHDLARALGYGDDDLLIIPDNVGGRFSRFSAAGLLPAAIMGLDVRALLLGASSMTRRFLEEPFERNPVLQFAAVNYLMSEELGKPIRVLAVWSKRLESLGLWYDQLLAESLGKQGRGPAPITAVQTRDLHSRGQQHQEGARDKMTNHVVVKVPRTPPIMISMADHNEDDLNWLNRKGFPDFMAAAYRATVQATAEVARPSADIVLPVLSEHTMGQLMQMLMLATVIEGRLMGINPYGQPGVEAYKRHMKQILKSS